MNHLIINGISVDIGKDQVVALTKESNDLFDIKDKRSNLSNTWKLPKTQNNNLIFNSANDLSSAEINRNFYDVIYIQGYEEIISRGHGVMKSCKEFYEFAVYWGNISLKDTLGEKTLNDLDLDDLDTDWNLKANDGIVDSETGLVVDSKVQLIYPICNTFVDEKYRTGAETQPLFPARQIPFVSFARILRQIAIDNDLEFSGLDELTEAELEDDKWIPVVDRKSKFTVDQNLTNDTENELFSETGSGTFEHFATINYESVEYWQSVGTAVYEFNLFTSLRFGAIKPPSSSPTPINVSFIIFAQTSDDGGTTWSNSSLANYAAVDAALTDGTIRGFKSNFTEIITSGQNYRNVDGEISFRQTLTNNHLIRFRGIFQFIHASSIDVLLYNRVGTNLEILKDFTRFQDVYPIALNMPEISQIDILKYAAAITGKLIDIEDGTNIVRFIDFNDLIESVGSAETLEIEDYEITDFHTKLGRKNILKYENDEEVSQITGRGEFSIDDNTLQKIFELYTAPFSASRHEIWEYEGNENAETIGLYPVLEAWDSEFQDVTPRIFNIQFKHFEEDLYFDATPSPIAFTRKYIAKFGGTLDFQNIADSRYSRYRTIMNNYVKITARAYITSSRFKQLDTPVLVYDERMGYCLLTKISDFVENKITKLELIKV